MITNKPIYGDKISTIYHPPSLPTKHLFIYLNVDNHCH